MYASNGDVACVRALARTDRYGFSTMVPWYSKRVRLVVHKDRDLDHCTRPGHSPCALRGALSLIATVLSNCTGIAKHESHVIAVAVSELRALRCTTMVLKYSSTSTRVPSSIAIVTTIWYMVFEVLEYSSPLAHCCVGESPGVFCGTRFCVLRPEGRGGGGEERRKSSPRGNGEPSQQEDEQPHRSPCCPL